MKSYKLFCEGALCPFREHSSQHGCMKNLKKFFTASMAIAAHNEWQTFHRQKLCWSCDHDRSAWLQLQHSFWRWNFCHSLCAAMAIEAVKKFLNFSCDCVVSYALWMGRERLHKIIYNSTLLHPKIMGKIPLNSLLNKLSFGMFFKVRRYTIEKLWILMSLCHGLESYSKTLP